ncbi:MAG TPA: hypothetical protein VL970_02920 [Candidatus Acidoferrales bacterium]|nr:hypothetical protein [Candidatus Acidoferrales bacterium]
MKKTTMILMVAGGLTFQAVAADPATGTSAQTKAQTNAPAQTKPKTNSSGENKPQANSSPEFKLQITTVLPIPELAHPKTVPSYETNFEIEHFGNVSLRPWSEIAGQLPAPAFEDQREYLREPHFPLFWIGASPQ